MYSNDENLKIARNMIRFGGSFMTALGNALLVADIENTKKINENWSDECKKYLNIPS